jgi:hypothetical protein
VVRRSSLVSLPSLALFVPVDSGPVESLLAANFSAELSRKIRLGLPTHKCNRVILLSSKASHAVSGGSACPHQYRRDARNFC